MNIILTENGKEKVLATGSEAEILKFWESKKEQLIGWLQEQDSSPEDFENYQAASSEEVDSLEELECIFRKYLDYSWWTLSVQDSSSR